MKRIFSVFLLVTLFISIYLFHFPVTNSETIKTTLPIENPWLTILLVPLDSRPPCTQFVDQLGRMVGIKVILPPDDLLDHFRTPSDKAALRQWLKTAAPQADAAIISIDMLIHGGLLSSRLGMGTSEDISETLALLRDIHQDSPQTKLYAFSIIPRLLVADGSDSAAYKKDLLNYSILKNQIALFENPLDYKKLQKIESQIPAKVIADYESLYNQNLKLNKQLLDLVHDHTLSELVIGQDDGHSFGIPNLIKEKLQNLITHDEELVNHVIVTRGADEIAADLLARIAAQKAHKEPRIYVVYSTEEAPAVIMPYMPHSVQTTVQEKIAMLHGQEVSTPDEATFLLYVHIGTKETTDEKKEQAANEIKRFMAQGYPVALVDLSENFYADQCLFPLLLKEKVKVAELAAYAGWNTTSNSIGTAVAEAFAATSTLGSADEILQRDQARLEFLFSRFADDYYYQKEIQPWINKRVTNLNADPYNLPDAKMQDTTETIQHFIAAKNKDFFQKALKGKLIVLEDQAGKRLYRIPSFSIDSTLPWERTFEIKVQPQFQLQIEN
ncbi:MAG: DUF4127 family protein [Sporomusaceae bacterium]|nr:DUF4127 family protein [Sporomusaceae bacterium]